MALDGATSFSLNPKATIIFYSLPLLIKTEANDSRAGKFTP